MPVPYAGLFAPLVADLFLDSYYQVDASTKSKMEEMLLTWRDGGQQGREVFGVVPQVAIERAIWQTSLTSRAPVSLSYMRLIFLFIMNDRYLDPIPRQDPMPRKYPRLKSSLILKSRLLSRSATSR